MFCSQSQGIALKHWNGYICRALTSEPFFMGNLQIDLFSFLIFGNLWHVCDGTSQFFIILAPFKFAGENNLDYIWSGYYLDFVDAQLWSWYVFISFCVRLVYESWVNRMHGTVSHLLPIPTTFLLWWEELLLQYDECHETHVSIGKSDLKKLHPISDTFHSLSRERLIPRTSLAG